MANTIRITRKDKYLTQDQIVQLFNQFIKDSYYGKRTKKNGQRISYGTIKNYEYTLKALNGFVASTNFELKCYIIPHLTARQRTSVSNYYKRFYKKFTNYLYNKKKYFDNYVGLIIRFLRAFFNYLRVERGFAIGEYHKLFYVPSENIPIVVISPDQFGYIIKNEEFNHKVNSEGLTLAKDIFVFGCVVGLRISDLMSLTTKNLQVKGNRYYINVKSQKTGVFTSVKLPEFAVEIIKKYRRKQKTLLPKRSVNWVNQQLKLLGQLIPDNFELIKTRERRGKQVVVYKDPIKKTHYQLSDHITAHTMRKTAITNMLSMGMPEYMVRKISGHAANSKEFFRYVELAQSYIDDETDRVFDQIIQHANQN